ncbi:MAG: class I SAM-dependent methyltransferase, partial [Candidatus Bathyarchaeota archaeon]|nr:class I SAM-dependent methyltransferase [Candidatus Bathyarchaeota archaeon]
LGEVHPMIPETIDTLNMWIRETYMRVSHIFPTQSIKLEPIETEGFILDIGGGGEGVIGKLNGRQVIAIDKVKAELEETDNPSLKVVMDATDLLFENASFDAATSFYTFMYMDESTQKKAIEETFRVLKPDGILHVWDVTLGPEHAEKPFFVVPMEIQLPGETIETGYGHRGNKTLSIESITSMGTMTGFVVEEKKVIQDSFYVSLRRP